MTDEKADKATTDKVEAKDVGTSRRSLADDLPGDTFAEKFEALFRRRFDGTALTNHTTLWNMVHEFKEDGKALHLELASPKP